ncbi:class F sortase [Nocardioides terrisoli]|uniref:class F sortase n=1 Tax=Nocardioides terrisoli TaxID=3388267 RepID=UPI00287B662B|nr:class F sortase [Nocardioides marmorisolisilvae]
MTQTPLRSVLDRLEKTGRTLTAVALWLLLGATVGGLVFPAEPGIAAPGYHDLARPAAPVRLLVPSLHIDAPIVPIEVTGDTLDPPSNPREVGWWRGSAKPGSFTGQTVITGHTVHTGGGQMDHLGSIKQGGIIKIVTPLDTMWYRETSVVVYSKEQLSRHAQDLFSQKRKHNRLVLITCTGWTGVEYTSNVIVFAKPLGVPNPKPHKSDKARHQG